MYRAEGRSSKDESHERVALFFGGHMASHRSKEEWRSLIAEHESSGESQAKFCRERGISPSAFQYHLHKGRKRDFIELPALTVQEGASGAQATLELPGGAMLRFSW